MQGSVGNQQSRQHSGLLLCALFAASCQTQGAVDTRAEDVQGQDSLASSHFPRPDREREPGFQLRSREESNWWLRARFPLSIAITDFRIGDGISIDQLTTVSFVPTLEAPVVLSERWTMVPYAGLGAAYQNGDRDLVGNQNWVGLAKLGLRFSRWQPFGERYAWLAKSEVRYDAALNGPDGVLGDWGNVDLAFELRRVFGSPGSTARWQPGIYIEGVHYWQSLEVNIEGVSPEFIEDQLEVGISLGTNVDYEVFGWALPRVFIGFHRGEELRGIRIRFGQL